MPNNFFEFRQFTINQDKTAMKVGTDGVLLGAWTNAENAKTIIDIGTGTGLIALMLAQKNNNSKITAIEINENAYNQAKENIEKSKFQKNIEVIHSDFRNYAETENRKFDLIVSNPPFFINSLKNNCENKTQARHNENLPYIDLLKYADKLSHENSNLSLILPVEQKENLLKICEEYNFFCSRITYIKPNPVKSVKRVLMSFVKIKTQLTENELLIEKDKRHLYSDEFINLTKEFYLDKMFTKHI